MRKQLKRMGFSYDWDREVASFYPTTTGGINGFSSGCTRKALPTRRLLGELVRLVPDGIGQRAGEGASAGVVRRRSVKRNSINGS